MPRRNRPPKRIPPPDVKYGNLHVAMFINRMMRGGKKSVATRIMYDALDCNRRAHEERPGRGL